MGKKTIYILSIMCFLIFAFVIKMNIHTVIPGVLYRSGQLPASVFDRFVSAHQISTVINLRGASPEDDWYQSEKKIAEDKKITYIDWDTLMARGESNPADLRQFVSLLSHVKKPIYVHCEGGSDRSSVAVILYLLSETNWPLGKITAQSGYRYLAFHQDSAAKLILIKYTMWLNAHHVEHSPKQFKRFLQSSGLY